MHIQTESNFAGRKIEGQRTGFSVRCFLSFLEALQGDPCGILLGALFAGAGAGADGNAVELDFHPEPLVVIRALLPHQTVAENLVLLLLDLLLQGGLVVDVMQLRHGHVAQDEGGDNTLPNLWETTTQDLTTFCPQVVLLNSTPY